jgi:hypothetical protein
MKGISYITDEANNRKSLVIDLKSIEKYGEKIHEFIDVLMAESRKDEESISWEDAKIQLRAAGKL